MKFHKFKMWIWQTFNFPYVLPGAKYTPEMFGVIDRPITFRGGNDIIEITALGGGGGGGNDLSFSRNGGGKLDIKQKEFEEWADKDKDMKEFLLALRNEEMSQSSHGRDWNSNRFASDKWQKLARKIWQAAANSKLN